jgi:hypothetical protein
LIAGGEVTDKMRVAPRKLEKHMAEVGVIDAARQEEFVGKVVQQISGTMTTSLANNGAGLGSLGFYEAKVRELCHKAGFSSVRRVPLENPFNNLYEAKP